LGIEADTPVVVVHAGANQTDMGAAARVYWTLKSLGVQDLALLNGGFAGLDLGRSAQSASPASFIPSTSPRLDRHLARRHRRGRSPGRAAMPG
jgi:thiosulfate/3-mercaptopyruvate sulfurtransferase